MIDNKIDLQRSHAILEINNKRIKKILNPQALSNNGHPQDSLSSLQENLQSQLKEIQHLRCSQKQEMRKILKKIGKKHGSIKID